MCICQSKLTDIWIVFKAVICSKEVTSNEKERKDKYN
jgi:hypothetical protein